MFRRGAQATVQRTKHASQHDAEDGYAEAEGNHVLGVAQVEVPYSKNEQVCDHEIGHALKHVHGG